MKEAFKLDEPEGGSLGTQGLMTQRQKSKVGNRKVSDPCLIYLGSEKFKLANFRPQTSDLSPPP